MNYIGGINNAPFTKAMLFLFVIKIYEVFGKLYLCLLIYVLLDFAPGVERFSSALKKNEKKRQDGGRGYQ